MIGRLPELGVIANVTSSMTFRDDKDALFARLEAVLHENAVLQRRNAELQRQPPAQTHPLPLPGAVACLTCGRPNDFRKSDCVYCGAALRRDSFGNTLRGHAPAWPALRPKTLGHGSQAITQKTHGPVARGSSHAWNVGAGVLLAVFVLGFFITVKLLALDGVG